MIADLDEIRLPLDLNGEWFVRNDTTAEGMFPADISGTAGYRTVTIPSDLAGCFPEEPYATGVFWFKKHFLLGEAYASKRLVLRFDAVNYSAHVYLNGKYLGFNDQGFLPFEMELTDEVRFNEINELTVRVDTRRKQGQLPTSFYWKNCGGIIRDVCIYCTCSSYIDDAFVEAHADGTAVFHTSIVSDMPLTQRIVVKDASGETLHERLTSVCGGEYAVETQTENIVPWSMDVPSLYSAEITLEDSGTVLDKRTVVFGYRDITAADGKLYLNGQEVFLKGFNRHEDHPQCGGAACEEVVNADFEMIKASGANFVRMCHYPHDQRELDLADKLGLALLVEIPLCAYMGDTFGIEGSENKPQNEMVYANSCECLKRMIRRDRNHPSVLIWSVSNENREPDNFEVLDNHKGLLQLAKKLDPTRLATHVSTYSTDPNCYNYFVYDDVICFNAYPTLNYRVEQRNENYDYSESQEMITQTVEKIRKLYPHKPIVVTEFGYRTGIPFDSVDDEEIQARAISAEFEAACRCANGASIWLFADHLWPNDHRLLSDVSRFGLLNRDRSKKLSYEVFCNLLKQKR